MLSPSQLKRYWLELRAVQSALAMRNDRCSMLNAQSSDTPSPTQSSALSPQSSPSSAPSASPREKFDRAAFHTLHNLPPSTKSFTQKHFDTFLAACRAITQPSNLKPQLRAFDQPKTRLLNKILINQAAQLRALEIANPSEYIAQICSDKFHGALPANLSANQIHKSRSSDRSYSDLDMLLWTIADRIKTLRQQKGWTEHELLWQADLGASCSCADCSKRRPKVGRVAPRAPSPELAIAESNPF